MFVHLKQTSAYKYPITRMGDRTIYHNEDRPCNACFNFDESEKWIGGLFYYIIHYYYCKGTTLKIQRVAFTEDEGEELSSNKLVPSR